jgi:hypothetical protein
MPRQTFAYEHTDVPPGMTLSEWRRMRTSGRPGGKAASGGGRRVLRAILVRRLRAA